MLVPSLANEPTATGVPQLLKVRVPPRHLVVQIRAIVKANPTDVVRRGPTQLNPRAGPGFHLVDHSRLESTG